MNAQGENIPKVNSNPLKHCFHTKYVLFYVMIMLFTKKLLFVSICTLFSHDVIKEPLMLVVINFK